MITIEKIYRKSGQKVKRQRKALKWTQEQLAECADLSPQYLSRIERGVAAPTLETLYKLATVLQCSIHQLLPETQTPEKLIHFETAAIVSFWTPPTLMALMSMLHMRLLKENKIQILLTVRH